MSNSRLNTIVDCLFRKFRYKFSDCLGLSIMSGNDYRLSCYLLIFAFDFAYLNQYLTYKAHCVSLGKVECRKYHIANFSKQTQVEVSIT